MAEIQETSVTSARQKHIVRPSQEMASLGKDDMPVLTKAEGIYVYAEDGRRLIDGPAGMWCTQIGYGRKEVVDAIAHQASTISFASPWYMSTSPSARLAEKIASLTPGDLNRIFFTTGGSTAVDSALRFTEFYNNVLGRPAKKRIISRIDGYHGSTGLAASVTGRKGSWANFDIETDRVSFLSSPNPRHAGSRTEAEFLDDLVKEFEDRIEALGADTVAAFIAEPLLANAGVIIPPKGYHARFKAVCEKHDILYISDEVVTAFGRCGEWFASEKVFDVTPDIITFAKGVTSGYVPLGGFAISDAVIARIDARDLEARRTRARALVHQRELEHTAAKPLRNSGVITEADLASAVANLEGARAELRNIELQLANVQVKAPVAAILERRLVERGDFVKVGAAIATLIVNDPLLISGGVSENEIEKVRPGAKATATLNDGRVLDGVVRYVSARANEQTRTFTVEVEVRNPGAKIPAGLSAKVSIPVGSVMAHRLPSALLSLDDQGVLGVKSVNDEGRVVFHEARIERADGDAVWLSSLPDQLKIITRGQGFVQPGEQVRVADSNAQ